MIKDIDLNVAHTSTCTSILYIVEAVMTARPSEGIETPGYIISPPFYLEGDTSYCLKLRYFMSGDDIGTLKVN